VSHHWLYALGGLLALFLVGGLLSSAHRGPWVDEFWTLWQSRHDLSLAEVFRERWSADFHPPLFSILHWLWTPLVGESMLSHRLLNLLPLAWAVGFVTLCARRYPRSFDVVGLYALLLLSFPVTLQYFAETRSYFWQICVLFVLIGSWVVVQGEQRDLDWRRDRALALMIVANVVLAFNLHYFVSLVVGLLVLAAAALCRRHGQPQWGRLWLGTAAVAVLPLLAFVATQSAFLSDESTHYWVTGGAREALDRLATAARRALAANAVGSLAALVVALAALDRLFARPVRRGVFDARFGARCGLTGPRGELLAALVVSVAVYAAALLVLHAYRPIVYERYLIGFQAVALSIVALLAAPLVAHWRILAPLALACAVGTTTLTAWRTEREQRWDATAQAAAAAVKACPGAQVFSVLPERAKGSRNSQTVLRWAYEREGDLWGFKPSPLYAGGAVRWAGDCPAILWLEHADRLDIRQAVANPSLALHSFGLDVGEFDVRRARTIAGSSGVVLIGPHHRDGGAAS
jgi:hypothetical protein